MPGSSSSVLEEEVLIFSVSKKWTSLLSGASMQQETQGEWVSFLPFSKGKGAQKQMLPDTNYSDLSPAPIPQGSCQYLAVSLGQIQIETGEHNRRKAITDPSAPSPSLLPWPACTTLGGVLRDEIWRKNQGILSPDEAHQFGNLRASGHAFPRLISEMAVSSSFTHLNNDISPQAECYTRCQVTHFTVLILSEVTGATGLLTVQITFWEEQ